MVSVWESEGSRERLSHFGMRNFNLLSLSLHSGRARNREMKRDDVWLPLTRELRSKTSFSPFNSSFAGRNHVSRLPMIFLSLRRKWWALCIASAAFFEIVSSLFRVQYEFHSEFPDLREKKTLSLSTLPHVNVSAIIACRHALLCTYSSLWWKMWLLAAAISPHGGFARRKKITQTCFSSSSLRPGNEAIWGERRKSKARTLKETYCLHQFVQFVFLNSPHPLIGQWYSATIFCLRCVTWIRPHLCFPCQPASAFSTFVGARAL